MAHYQYEGQHYELPDGLSNEQAMGKIHSHLNLGAIPGQEKEPARKAGLIADRSQESIGSKIKNTAVGLGEAALNLGTGLYAGMAAPVSASLQGLFGMVPDSEKEAGRLMEDKTYAPRTERGQDYAETAGKFIGDLLMPMGPGNLSGMAHLSNQMRVGKAPIVPELAKPTMEETLAQHQAPKQAETIPSQGTIRVGQDGDAYHTSPVVEQARTAAEQRMLSENDRIYNEQQQQNLFDMPEKAVQEEIPFQSSVEDIAAQQAKASPQADMFAGNELPARPLEASRSLVEGRTEPTVPSGLGDPLAVAGREFPKENLQVVEKPTIERAADKVAAGQSFLLTPEERIMWEKTNPGIQLADMGNEPLPGKEGDVYYARGNQRGSAPMLNDIANGIIKVGQGVKAMFTGEIPKVDSSLLRPTSPQDIQAKQVLASKATAVGLDNSVYHAVKTIEEVQANPGKDITTNAQDLAPGMQAVLRKNKSNKLLSFVNNGFTEARLGKMKDSVRLITDKTDSYMSKMKEVSQTELQSVHELSLALDRTGKTWTHELGDKLGWSEEAKAFMDKRMYVNDEVANKADQVLSQNGMKLLDRRASYAPATFDTKYQQLVYKTNKDGSYSIVAPLNAKSAWELSKAKEWATEKFGAQLKSGEYVIDNVKRQGLSSDTSKYKPMSDSARLMSTLAEKVPEVAGLKAELDAFIENQTKNLYGHNVHELHKKGVVGSIGDRPWLDAKQNAKDFFQAEIGHVEQALDYWHYQDAIGQTRKAVLDQSIVGMDKTKKYLSRFIDSNYGGALNPLGALSNSLVDIAYQGMQKTAVGSNKALGAKKGWSPEDNPAGHLGNIRDVMSSEMMGWVNPMFTGVQLTQLATGVGPELARIRSEFGLNPVTIASSITHGLVSTTLMSIASKAGKLDAMKAILPEHTIEAYKWAKEHGITKYNEIEQEHSAEHPATSTLKSWATKPAAIGEILSTPPAFIAVSNMLHESGMRGEALHVAAYEALKYAMTEYHPDAAPLVYTRSGIAGKTAGGLKKFLHNAVDQQASRILEAKEHPAAFATMVGTFAFFAGATGILGYNQADKLSLLLTDNSLKQHWDDAFGKGYHSRGIRDGYASALTNWDLQTRYSMGDNIPTSFAEGLQGPHLTKALTEIAAAYNYAKNRDTMSGLDLAKSVVPAGTFTGMLDQATNVTPEGAVLDKEGQNKYPEPRTPKEQQARKYLGVRPLRERLEDERVYNQTLIDAKKNKKRADANTRINAAIYRNDTAGFSKAIQDYKDNEGQMDQLGPHIEKYMQEKGLTNAQRRGGIAPGNNLERFQRYNK